VSFAAYIDSSYLIASVDLPLRLWILNPRRIERTLLLCASLGGALWGVEFLDLTRASERELIVSSSSLRSA
jgi:hypothetical protein